MRAARVGLLPIPPVWLRRGAAAAFAGLALVGTGCAVLPRDIGALEQPRAALAAPVVPPVGLSVRTLNDVRAIIQAVVTASFPELAGAQIVVEAFASDGDFFRSTIRPSDALKSGPLTFVVQVNPRCFALQISSEAVRGVVAHELVHTAAFATGGRPAVAAAAVVTLGAMAVPGTDAAYERRTDLEAVVRGYAADLAAFRAFQAAVLPPKIFKGKQLTYLTAAELRLSETALKEHPALLARWRHQPPASLAEMTAEVSAAADRR